MNAKDSVADIDSLFQWMQEEEEEDSTPDDAQSSVQEFHR